ncbi:hypothetical protein [Pseudomonas oryzihabitans]|uniref:hypothetical protein n=1 Tax=Pseudomonas oryzihabitans TaxID=47885 RepID=UPI00289396CD|nr:hypothetical protein [Pseudomonas oryzihabitans]MDT3718756.1 hypothetical protein [Pseudomonas oryzihabitans]
MNLLELARRHPQQPADGVPAWILGHFRRRSITFADGRSDTRTQVHWLQSRSFTLDLRLPDAPSPPLKAWADYRTEELRQLANQEGWMADSHWVDGQLSWHGGVSLHVHNRWPEPARLQRIGNCLMEFAPSGAYVEDWRLQAGGGPLIGLRLWEEREVESGRLLGRGGGLILCGDRLGWVRGRPQPLAESPLGLRERVAQAQGDPAELARLFDVETSLALADGQGGYRVALSTLPARLGRSVALDGFAWDAAGHLRQRLINTEGCLIERTFEVDTLEPDWHAEVATPCSAAAQVWFVAERETLARDLEILT